MSYKEMEIRINPGNDASKSKYKDFFGVPFYDDGKLINGEKIYEDGTIVRYVNGLIDGNIYDSRGRVIYTMPAVEHKKGIEYWSKGWPQGSPAIILKRRSYEEYWKNQELKKISLEKKQQLVYYQGPPKDMRIGVTESSYGRGFGSAGSYSYEIDIEKHGIDYYLSLDAKMPFKDRLIHIIRIKNMTFPELYHSINMNAKTFHKVKNSKPSESISYDNAVMIAFGLQLTFDEMVKFLNFSGNGFRNFGKRDEIVREFFEKGNYKLFELNTKLGAANQKMFGMVKEERYFSL
jgi:hypothetical protein